MDREVDETATRTRGTALLLIGLAVIFEAIAWPISEETATGLAASAALSFLARFLVCGAGVFAVSRVSSSRGLIGAVYVAACLLLLNALLGISEKVNALVHVPVLGREGAFHDIVDECFAVGGYASFVGAFSLALVEIHTSRRKLASANADLAGEIEARAAAVAALERKEHALAEAQEIARIGSWEWDEAAGTLTCSDVLASILDLGTDQLEVSYEGFLERLHPSDRERVDRVIQDAWANRQAVEFYCRVVQPGGSVRMLHSRGRVFVDDRGQPARIVGTAQDVTELRQAEEALARERDLLRTLIDNVPVYIFIKDAESHFLLSNAAHLRLLGAKSQEQLAGRTDFDIFPDELAAGYYADEREILRTGRPLLNREEVTIDPQGKEIYLLTTKVPMYDAQGAPVSILGIGLDVTERRRIELQLLESEAKFRAIVETTREWIWSMDRQGRMTYNNPAVETILGYTPDELHGRDTLEFMHPDDRRQVEAMLPEAIAEKRGWSDFILRWLHKDGSCRYLESNAVPVFDGRGEVAGFLGADRDVTERIRAEEALRDNERFLSDVFASIQDGISILDTQYRIIRVNAVMERWYAHCMPLAGKKCYEAYHARSEPCGVCPTARSLKSLQAASDVVHRERSEAAPESWWEVHSFPLFARGTGGLNGVIEYVRDITARRAADEERRRLEDQLRHAQKLESLGIMAGGVAHDFNNILQGILGNASLALLDLPPDSPAGRSVKDIELFARRAAELSGQMLAYSGRGTFVVEPLDLNEVVAEITNLLAAIIPKGILARYDLAEHLPAIEADVTQVRQVIVNLVTNASEAIGEKTGAITIATSTGEYDEASLKSGYLPDNLPHGRYVRLDVTDTGCGMDEKTQARIFDPFFSTKFTGRGLGLSATLGIVRGHRGTIQVDSTPGQGTTFTVLFPASSRAATFKAPEPAPAEAWRGAGTVLVADDEEAVREVTGCLLEYLGFHVLKATNGIEAVGLFEKHAQEIVCVILDLTMPHMGGAEAYQELRRIRDNVRVVLSSGYSEEDVAQRFAGQGLAGFLKKPYTADTLAEKVRAALTV